MFLIHIELTFCVSAATRSTCRQTRKVFRPQSLAPAEKDTAMQALREVMGITNRNSINALSEEKQVEYRRRRSELNDKWPVTVRDFVDHIDHAVKLIGIEHVGISSDSESPRLSRGFAESQISL